MQHIGQERLETITKILERLEKSNDLPKTNYITILQTPDLIKTSVDQSYYQYYFKNYEKMSTKFHPLSSTVRLVHWNSIKITR